MLLSFRLKKHKAVNPVAPKKGEICDRAACHSCLPALLFIRHIQECCNSNNYYFIRAIMVKSVSINLKVVQLEGQRLSGFNKIKEMRLNVNSLHKYYRSSVDPI